MADDYEIGYGKPPRADQFRKGKSGNPQGRPKGSQNVSTILNKVIYEEIEIKENGRVRRVTKLEAIVLQITNKAVAGDQKAGKEVSLSDEEYQTMLRHDLLTFVDRSFAELNPGQELSLAAASSTATMAF